MPSPRKRSQKLPLYHNSQKRREDPLKILLAWVALLAVASTIWSLLHHHRRSAPEVDIHPSLIHYDARGGALLNINGTEPPEYARRDWQHLGTFRGAKGCLDAARGPGAAPCRSLAPAWESTSELGCIIVASMAWDLDAIEQTQSWSVGAPET